MAATVNDGGDLYPWVSAPDIEGTAALGAVELVSGERRQIDIHLVDVEGNLAQCLDGVGVEEHTALAAELADLFQRLQHADFVVRSHNADQDRLVREGFFE